MVQTKKLLISITTLLKKGSKLSIGGTNELKTGFFGRAFPKITLFLAISGTLSLSTRQKPGFFSRVVSLLGTLQSQLLIGKPISTIADQLPPFFTELVDVLI